MACASIVPRRLIPTLTAPHIFPSTISTRTNVVQRTGLHASQDDRLDDLLRWGFLLTKSNRAGSTLILFLYASKAFTSSISVALEITVFWSTITESVLSRTNAALNELDVRRFFKSLQTAASVSKNFAT